MRFVKERASAFVIRRDGSEASAWRTVSSFASHRSESYVMEAQVVSVGTERLRVSFLSIYRTGVSTSQCSVCSDVGPGRRPSSS